MICMRKLFINSTAHFLTDAVCAAALYGAVREGSGDFTFSLMVYNTLAFSTQCVVGLVLDRLRRHERLAALGLLCCCGGLLLPMGPAARVAAAGLGNSLFHVAGGTVTLREAAGRAAPLGAFVAPGALGLTLGTLYPELGVYFAAAAAALCAVMALLPPEGEREAPPARPVTAPAVAALLLAVAARAVGGSAAAFPWRLGAPEIIAMSACVMAGKAAGGLMCDRLGAARTAYASIVPAAALIALCSAWMLPALLGQLLLNLTMPVTLWLLYKAMPDSPGLSFGLAASVLWPGTMAGQLIVLTGPGRKALIMLCLAFGLLAIIYAQKKLKEVSL